MRVDVFLDTGVTFEIPDGSDLNSAEVYKLVKETATEQFRQLLRTDFDVQYEEAPEL